MRIVIFGGGANLFGMEQITARVAHGLRLGGHEVLYLLCGWNDGKLAELLEEYGVAYEPLKLGRLYKRNVSYNIDTLRHFPRALLRAMSISQSVRPHVVVCVAPGFSPLLGWVFGRDKLVLYLHDMPEGDRWDRHIAHWIRKRQVPIIACGPNVVEKWVSLGVPRDNAYTVVNGIDVREFHGAAAERAQQAINIGMVGQIIPRKGCDLLVGAFGVVLQRAPHARLHIIGEGNGAYADNLRGATAPLERAGSVIWRGWVRDKREIFRDLDIVAIPSRSEGFCLTAIEAGAAGLPVVASRIPGLTEIVVDGETGLLCQADDESEFASALLKLISDAALRKRVGTAARERVNSNFTADATVAQFVKALVAISGTRSAEQH